MTHRSVFALALLLLIQACVKTAPPQASQKPGAPDATLVLASELKGYLGPCGCSENMRGGIARAAEQLRLIRDEGSPVFFVASGDTLFGGAKILGDSVPQQEMKAAALAQSLKQMKLDVSLPGTLDDARGEAFRKAQGLPELVATQVLERNGFRLGLVSGNNHVELETRAMEARKKGAQFVVGLFAGAFEDAVKNAPASGVDALVATRTPDETAGELNRFMRGAVPVAQLQNKGRSLLRIDLWNGPQDRPTLFSSAQDQEKELAALDERIASLKTQINEPGLSPEMHKLKQDKFVELQQRRQRLAQERPTIPSGQRAFTVGFIPLESTISEEASVKRIVDQYDTQVNTLNLQRAQTSGKDCPAPSSGEVFIVGNQGCKACHANAFPVWEATKHSVALKTLETKNKQYHLDCIACHVTGWQQTGGVCRVDHTNDRNFVGCEMCHGPGSAHVNVPKKNNILKGNDAKRCRSCHDHENSPDFAFEKYIPKIVGKGHGG